MKRNRLGYLGLLGLLGFLGFMTERPSWFLSFSFFSFFTGFFPRKGVSSDERVEMNLSRASRNAFAFMMATATFSVAYVEVFGAVEVFTRLVLTALFAVGLNIFAFSYLYFDMSGN